jgi:hypothetical protein
MSLPAVYVTNYTGTTAAQTITLGFRPKAFIAWNRTDGDTVLFWADGVTTTLVSVDTEAATETITVTATDHGISLPTNAVINENAKVYDIIAFRGQS